MGFEFAGLTLFQMIVSVGVGVSSCLYLLGIYSGFELFGWRRGRRAAGLPSAVKLPAVTVLKPLKGEDVELHENLKTLCEQRYDRFQLVFGVADPRDPAIAVVRRLQREYPERDIELVVDRRVYGSNYKVSNLHNMLARAKHDVLVIADSDIRVGPDYLRQLVIGLRNPRVGIVTCLYRAVNRDGLPTRLEALFINTDFAGLVLLARKVERSTYAFGATIAMRRDVLDAIGGFLPLADHLADDYQLGNRVAALGYELVLSTEVVDTVIALGSWRRLFDHQLRWARTYRICRPGGYLGSLLTHGTFWALLNVLGHAFSPASVAASATALAVRHLYAALLSWRFLGTDLRPLDLCWLVPKDLFVTLVWFAAFAGNTVSWSGRRFRVLPGGEMVDLSPDAPPRVQATAEPAPDVQRRRTGTNGR